MTHTAQHAAEDGSLRVLLVSPVGECGGAELVLLNLARRLPALGIHPVLACLQPGPLTDRARAQGLEVHAFTAHRYRQPHRVWQGIGWLDDITRRVRPDVLHSNHMGHLYAHWVSRRRHVPELWHVYDYPYHVDRLERFVQSLPAEYVLFATQRVRSGYPRLHRFPHSVVYPSCVEVEQLRAMPVVPGVRERLGLPASGPLFVTVARLQQHKGHASLLEAVPAVLQEYPDAAFALVGKASGPEQEAYRDELKRLAARLGVEGRVMFCGYVADGDMAALLREATALVHPAVSEGFGLTLLEAMALQTPVIAARADGPSEILSAPDSGLLVPTGDRHALAEAMLHLLRAPELAAALRAGGTRRVNDFRIETMVQQTADVYRSMTRRPVPAPRQTHMSTIL